MAVKVIIPTPLRAYAGKQESVELQANTVAEALDGLDQRFADLKKHLYSDDGRLRSFVNVYVNDEDIRYLQKDQTPLRDGDTSASCLRSPAARSTNREIQTGESFNGNQTRNFRDIRRCRRSLTSLSKEEILRYSRHLIMPEVGMEGQLKLKQAKVLCIGTGGLGAPLGLYLAAAGVGRIGSG